MHLICAQALEGLDTSVSVDWRRAVLVAEVRRLP